MLLGLASLVFIFCAVIMVLLILVQKGKNSLGLGSMGGANQFLFGGSGGQDFFQKATWVLGAILVFGSLSIALWKAKTVGSASSLKPTHEQRNIPAQSQQNMPI